MSSLGKFDIANPAAAVKAAEPNDMLSFLQLRQSAFRFLFALSLKNVPGFPRVSSKLTCSTTTSLSQAVWVAHMLRPTYVVSGDVLGSEEDENILLIRAMRDSNAGSSDVSSHIQWVSLPVSAGFFGGGEGWEVVSL